MWDIIEKEILPFVDKPARYVGGELNSIVKDNKGKTTIALIYPDIYEIGISNVGLKILYDILNRKNYIACERVYSPWIDMEQFLREKKISLFSLESKTPLARFDILGFTFQYELLYTNFLNILDLSGVPLYSKERNGSHPFVIAGGPVSGNLEPVAHFLDAVCIGDGESRIIEMVEVITRGKEKGRARSAILYDLSMIEGVYVPPLYVEKEENGYIIPVGKSIRRYSEPDLGKIPYVTAQILPHIQAVQDRAVLEVARGCGRGCRFCQAGVYYRPPRERTVKNLMKLSTEIIKKTGYREISLISLSISDYSDLQALIRAMDSQLSSHGVSFSLPSLRIDSFTLELARKVKEIRKSGLTFAVEGGTQAVRDAINKNVTEEELIKVIKIAYELGWKSVKLYFMIGLCSHERGVEISEIENLAMRIDSAVRGIKITLSVALFIPRPHTPFQWYGQMAAGHAREDFHDMIGFFKNKRNINIRYNDPEMSELEGVLCKGDRRLSLVIEKAFRKGARFDGWGDKFDLRLWKSAFEETGIDPLFYLKEKGTDAVLPWDFIIPGVTKRYLIKEKEKAASRIATGNCSPDCTNYCGNCNFKSEKPRFVKKTLGEKYKTDKRFLNRVLIDSKPRFVCRFLYTKTNNMRYLGPIDLEEVFERAFIRANIPIVYTRGFNPHLRVEMGWALPVGLSSNYEIAEIELSEKIRKKRLKTLLNMELPAGLKIIKIDLKALPSPKFTRICREHFVRFSFNSEFSEPVLLAKVKTMGEYMKAGMKGEKSINLNDYFKSIEFSGKRVFFTFIQKEGGARIRDFITYFTGMDARQSMTLEPLVERRFAVVDGIEKEIFYLI